MQTRRIVSPDDVDGPEQIPGKDLAPDDAGKRWRKIKRHAVGAVSEAEAMALELAEFWDRRGVNHLKGDFPMATIRNGIGVSSNGRLYAIIRYGRRKWHLRALEAKSDPTGHTSERIGERAMRPLLTNGVSAAKAAEVVKKASALATKESHERADVEGWSKKTEADIEVRPRHVTAALDELEPSEPTSPHSVLDTVSTAIRRAYRLANAADGVPEKVVFHLRQAVEAMP